MLKLILVMAMIFTPQQYNFSWSVGDLNGDGVVDMADFVMFANAWGHPTEKEVKLIIADNARLKKDLDDAKRYLKETYVNLADPNWAYAHYKSLIDPNYLETKK